jgi:hypothetical protein
LLDPPLPEWTDRSSGGRNAAVGSRDRSAAEPIVRHVAKLTIAFVG